MKELKPLHPSSHILHPFLSKSEITTVWARSVAAAWGWCSRRGIGDSHRLVALKMVLAGEFASPPKSCASAWRPNWPRRVQHPNIVQVYEIGSYKAPAIPRLGVGRGREPGGPTGWQALAPAVEAAALVETSLARAIDLKRACRRGRASGPEAGEHPLSRSSGLSGARS